MCKSKHQRKGYETKKNNIILLFTLCNLLSCKEYYLIKKNNLDDGLYAHIATTKGNILFKLDYMEKPLAVTNFIHMSKDSYYNDTIFKTENDNTMYTRKDNYDPGYFFSAETYKGDTVAAPGFIAFINSYNSKKSVRESRFVISKKFQ